MTPPGKIWTAIALAIPLLGLAGLTLLKHHARNHGQEIVLPIRGFDPRDLLSGHYLLYRIDYGIKTQCANKGKTIEKNAAAICLKPEKKLHIGASPPPNCSLFVRGTCKNNRFTSGLERFYIPLEHAKTLEDKVRDRHGELVLSISEDGEAAVKDLLIDGKNWKRFIAEQP